MRTFDTMYLSKWPINDGITGKIITRKLYKDKKTKNLLVNHEYSITKRSKIIGVTIGKVFLVLPLFSMPCVTIGTGTLEPQVSRLWCHFCNTSSSETRKLCWASFWQIRILRTENLKSDTFCFRWRLSERREFSWVLRHRERFWPARVFFRSRIVPKQSHSWKTLF